MLAVVIPTLNEGRHIRQLLETLDVYKDLLEIIVVDGGSTDNTVEVVKGFDNVQLVFSQKGRSIQLHAGAVAANCEYLLFLHGDTLPPKNFIEDAFSAMKQKDVSGGSFCLSFDHPHVLLRIYAAFTRINHLLFTYGDQGLFITKTMYMELGGFEPKCLMEDIDFQKKIRNAGKFIKIKKPVITSARRYKKNGFFIQQMKNNLLVILYHFGWPPEKLKKMYNDDVR